MHVTSFVLLVASPFFSLLNGGSNYRWPFGPPGPALARARAGPFLAGPCLARPNIAAGRVVLAHGLCRRPRHGPAGLFRAGPARGARPTCRARASCGPQWGALPHRYSAAGAATAAVERLRRRRGQSRAGGARGSAAAAAERRGREAARVELPLPIRRR